jgi:hypothetical protein
VTLYQVVGLDPSSYHGYELKHEALHGAQQYGEAIAAFEIMLSKLNVAPDTRNTPSKPHITHGKNMPDSFPRATPTVHHFI